VAISKDNIKVVLDIVGREGAVSALEKSKKVNIKDLIELARSIGLSPKSKESKKSISTQIIHYIDMRINKSLDELKAMSKEDLLQYFMQVECHQDELIEFLKSIDLKARVKSRKALMEFAAIQISSLGIFERLSNHERKELSEKPTLQKEEREDSIKPKPADQL